MIGDEAAPLGARLSNRLKAASEDAEVEVVTRPTFRWWLSISETLQPDHQVPRPLQDNLWVLKLVEEDKRPAPRGLPFGAEQLVKKIMGDPAPARIS